MASSVIRLSSRRGFNTTSGMAFEQPPLRYATAIQVGLAFIAGFLKARLALDGVAILREPKDATTEEARERMALIAPTLGGFVAGAAAGVGYLLAGFYSRFAQQLCCWR
jgi:hypothetical protein